MYRAAKYRVTSASPYHGSFSQTGVATVDGAVREVARIYGRDDGDSESRWNGGRQDISGLEEGASRNHRCRALERAGRQADNEVSVDGLRGLGERGIGGSGESENGCYHCLMHTVPFQSAVELASAGSIQFVDEERRMMIAAAPVSVVWGVR